MQSKVKMMVTARLSLRGAFFARRQPIQIMIGWISLLLLPTAYAATGGVNGFGSGLLNTSSLSAATMIANIATQVPSLMRLVTAIAYVLGMYFIFHGVIKLKHMGEQRTMMSHEHSIMPPIIFLCVGVALLYIPTSVQVGLSTFWVTPNPYGYTTSVPGQWSQFMNDCYIIIQLVGTIAFIRGLVILSRSGSQHSGQSSFGKGLTHIIGGILCINIYQFGQLILVTLGVQS